MSWWWATLLSSVVGLRLQARDDLMQIDGESNMTNASSSRLVFDIGMNRGDDTKEYLDLGYTVVAVEANPVWAKRNSRLFKARTDQGRLEIVNRVLSNNTGDHVDFWVGAFYPWYVAQQQSIHDGVNDSAWRWHVGASSVHNEASTIANDLAHIDEEASMDKKNGCQYPPSIMECRAHSVQTITCNDMIQEYGVPHFLKIDIEGYDGICMMQLATMSCDSLPLYISFEEQSFHPHNVVNSKDIMKALSARGYTWKVTSQELSAHGSSGSGFFGEEAIDYVKGKHWSEEKEAFGRTGPACWAGQNGAEFSSCDVHGKLNRKACTELHKNDEQNPV